MSDWSTLREQTLAFRRRIAALLDGDASRADVIPPGWNNNLRWHIGHLVVVPQLLTRGLAGERLAVPGDYRRWFSRGTSPTDWGEDPVPRLERLAAELVDASAELFDAFEARAGEPFARPYQTGLGPVLATPAQALSFSLAHDGLHLGWIRALQRALDATER